MIRVGALLTAAILAGGFWSAAGMAGGLPADPALIVYDWAPFANPALVQDYVDKYHKAPTYDTFANDTEAFQRISSGKKVDIAHPCSQMIASYRQSQLIAPWDVAKIPHFKDIDKRFLNSPVLSDKSGVWYIPTEYDYTAIAYDKATVPAGDVASLQVFVNPKYKGRTALPNNPDDVWALALLATGVSDWTHVSDAQFTAAANWIRKANANVMTYWTDPDELAQLMQSGQGGGGLGVERHGAGVEDGRVSGGVPAGAERGRLGLVLRLCEHSRRAGVGTEGVRLHQRLPGLQDGARALEDDRLSHDRDGLDVEDTAVGPEGRFRRSGDHDASGADAARCRDERPDGQHVREDQGGVLMPRQPRR